MKIQSTTYNHLSLIIRLGALYNCRDIFTDVVSALQIKLFMQNKAKLRKVKLNVNKVLKRNYVQMDNWSIRKKQSQTNPNKAKTTPILAQKKTQRTQFKPKQTQPVVSLSNLFHNPVQSSKRKKGLSENQPVCTFSAVAFPRAVRYSQYPTATSIIVPSRPPYGRVRLYTCSRYGRTTSYRFRITMGTARTMPISASPVISPEAKSKPFRPDFSTCSTGVARRLWKRWIIQWMIPPAKIGTESSRGR